MSKQSTRKRRRMVSAGLAVVAIAAGIAVMNQSEGEPGADEVGLKTWVTLGR